MTGRGKTHPSEVGTNILRQRNANPQKHTLIYLCITHTHTHTHTRTHTHPHTPTHTHKHTLLSYLAISKRMDRQTYTHTLTPTHTLSTLSLPHTHVSYANYNR